MHPQLKRPLATVLVVASVLAPTHVFAMSTVDSVVSSEVAKPMPMPMQNEETVLAEIKVDREQAIAVVNKLIPIPAGFGEPNVNIHQTQTGATWNLNWHATRNQPDLGSISADVDAITGELRSYWRYKPMMEETQVLTLTREEGFKFAEEWLRKLAGKYVGSLKYLDNSSEYGGYYGGNSHGYYWARQEQGYVVRDHNVNVTVNATTGELEGFYFYWNQDAKFEKPTVAVDLEKANSIYRNQLEMKLSYQRFYKPFTDEGFWRLVYQPANGWYPTVTLDGKLGDWSGGALDPAEATKVTPVPAPDKPYVAPQSPLTREQALAIAKAAAGRTDEPTSSSYSEWGETKKTRNWDFGWYPQHEMKEGDLSTNVMVNADTGVIAHLSNWGPYKEPKEGDKPAVSLEQAQATAIAFVRQHRPDLAGNLVLINDQGGYYERYGGPISNYYIRFQMLHNNIPILGHEVSLDIDAFTGKIRYFWASSEVTTELGSFPTTDGIVHSSVALENFLKHQGLEPVWTQKPVQPAESTAERILPIPMPVPMQNNEMHVIYAPKTTLPIAAFDAHTGVPLDYQGRNLIELAKKPTDIEGHFAQREIELFWQRGIFELEDGKFRPDAAATGADLARWLVLAKGLRPYPMYDFSLVGRGGAQASMAAEAMMKSADSAYWGAALQAGILLPEDFASMKDPEGEVSRQQFSLWAIRAMGYGRIAKIANKIELPFADASSVDPAYANALALLHGLGAINGDSTTVYGPAKAITRGEAAKIIFSVANETRR